MKVRDIFTFLTMTPGMTLLAAMGLAAIVFLLIRLFY